MSNPFAVMMGGGISEFYYLAFRNIDDEEIQFFKINKQSYAISRVGEAIPWPNTDSIQIVGLSTTELFIASSTTSEMYKYSCDEGFINWAQEEGPDAIGGSGSLTATALTPNTIAMQVNGLNKIPIFEQQTGYVEIAEGNLPDIYNAVGIAALGYDAPIARLWTESGIGKLATMTISGDNWSITSNTLSLGSHADGAITYMDATTVAVTNTTTDTLRAYRDDPDWATYGNSIALPASSNRYHLAGLDQGVIALYNSTIGKIRVYLFPDPDWEMASESDSVGAGSGITAMREYEA